MNAKCTTNQPDEARDHMAFNAQRLPPREPREGSRALGFPQTCPVWWCAVVCRSCPHPRPLLASGKAVRGKSRSDEGLTCASGERDGHAEREGGRKEPSGLAVPILQIPKGVVPAA